MPETTAHAKPHTIALSLIKKAALDETTHHAEDGPPPANWEIHDDLTTALNAWHAAGALHEESLALVEWLAGELSAYLLQQLGNQDRLQHWLRDFGDQVCHTQQHTHPAGPTAIDILSTVAINTATRPTRPLTANGLARIAAPHLAYLRAGHEVEDAHELALTLTLWAGTQLSTITHYNAANITAYVDARLAQLGDSADSGRTANRPEESHR